MSEQRTRQIGIVIDLNNCLIAPRWQTLLAEWPKDPSEARPAAS